MAANPFYLGRLFDFQAGKTTAQPLEYDPADLTTHAVVTGMTGSGKTGLCVSILEEAALQGIPALIIDPKGDLTNLLLHFPNLAPQDFQPWIDPDVARRAGKTLEQAATEAALAWRNGLAEWGIQPERLQALTHAVQFAIYTPGSDAGIPVSVLSSLEAPTLDWETNRETLRERISSTVTALLGLVGINDVDPVRSREHILLSNLFEAAWSQRRDIDLTELILQTQSPPFDKLGAFPVDTFFPPKDRMELAMALNNILASPAFQAWREGQPLDIQSLLFTPEGRPRHSIFYLAHLSDSERMFFVTLLFAAVESWMRTQAGSSALRALLYMDEIYGYLPPAANPPSKGPLLRMLKQARAFGLGLLLATQNPVDVDYKGLSNAGTWFIGKLQTEQDKNRLLDGLESASGGISRSVFDKLISSLGKRVFIMQNVHEKAPVLYQTRWAMNFLAGPITRTQIPALNDLVGAKKTIPAPQPASAPRPDPQADTVKMAFTTPAAAPVKTVDAAAGSLTRPPVPAGVAEYFLPQTLSLPEAFQAAGQPMPAEASIEAVLYRPALLAAAQVRFLDRKYGVESEVLRAALVLSPGKRGTLRWEDSPYRGPALEKIESTPPPSARFAMLDASLNDAKTIPSLQRDFVDWVYRSTTIKVRANEALKVYAGPDVSQAEFMKACADTARQARDAEIARQSAVLERKIKALEDKLAREERELRQDEAEYNQRKIEELGTHAENVLGLFGGRRSTRKLSSSLAKRRLTEQAKADVEESIEAIAQYKQELAELEKQRQELIEEINSRWGDVVNQITEITLTPKKTDIFVRFFGVAWLPYYLVRAGEETLELPAFGEG
ncbi:MAG: helicase HerA domain-containing protein [Anaerolineae bacterium]